MISQDDLVQITRLNKIPEEQFYPAINGMYERIMVTMLPQQLVTDGLSSKVKNNVITPPDTPIPDCLTCGACCRAFLCVGVRPTDTVDAELCWDITTTSEGEELIVDRYMKRDEETFACAALGGTIGERVSCEIYDTRPRMCHEFDAGSDRCHAIRRLFGIEPLLTVDGMMQALQKQRATPTRTDPPQTIRNTQIKREPGAETLVINALMKDGTILQIHSYDPELETWMQFEFDGLTLDEARELISSRRAT